MGTISRNFDYKEFERSEAAEKYGLCNVITTARVRDAIKNLVFTVLQPLRDYLKKAVNINSGYRSSMVNERVGGVPTSQHCKGEACDFYVKGLSTYDLAVAVTQLGLPYDQMILYPTFLHISKKLEGQDRHQLLYNKSYKGKRL